MLRCVVHAAAASGAWPGSAAAPGAALHAGTTAASARNGAAAAAWHARLAWPASRQAAQQAGLRCLLAARLPSGCPPSLSAASRGHCGASTQRSLCSLVTLLPSSLRFAILRQVEGIALDEDSLTYLGEIGEETSLRHAVQARSPRRAARAAADWHAAGVCVQAVLWLALRGNRTAGLAMHPSLALPCTHREGERWQRAAAQMRPERVGQLRPACWGEHHVSATARPSCPCRTVPGAPARLPPCPASPLQLMTPAAVLSRTNGREQVSRGDVEEVHTLFR